MYDNIEKQVKNFLIAKQLKRKIIYFTTNVCKNRMMSNSNCFGEII